MMQQIQCACDECGGKGKMIDPSKRCKKCMGKKISLKEALTGISFTVEHLDGRILHISTQPGAVLADGSAKMIEQEGMPMHGNPFVKGNLVIQFDIDYPTELDPKIAKQLESLLPGERETVEETQEMEPCLLRHFD